MRTTVTTSKAPAAIGTYSQAICVDNLVFLSGQIPLVPETMEMVEGGIEAQIDQVFSNLAAVAKAADANLNQVVKFTVYLTDLGHFPKVNAAMEKLLTKPYPARAAVEVSGLPRGASIEVEAILVRDN